MNLMEWLWLLPVLLSGLLTVLTARALLQYRLQTGVESDLPSLSILVPARNETHAIARTLDNLTRLNYPKLEIIVLDDRSHDDTPEKIRSFAQNGVRFIAGQPLPEHWIGKNWACQQLSEHASGEYILFCDIDTQLDSQGLQSLMQHIEHNQYAGASVQPRLVMNSWLGSMCAPVLVLTNQLLGSRHHKIHPSYGGLLVFRTQDWRTHGGYHRFKNEVLSEYKLAKNFREIGGFAFLGNGSTLNFQRNTSFDAINATRRRTLRHLGITSSRLLILHVTTLATPWITLLLWPWIYPLVLITVGIAYYQQIDRPWLPTLMWPLTCAVEFWLLIHSYTDHWRGAAQWKSRQLS